MRDENGRYVKGQSGNPSGRAPKDREERYYQITIQTVTFEDWAAIVRKAAAQAKHGDAQARKWLADYLIGPPRQDIDFSGTIHVSGLDDVLGMIYAKSNKPEP